MARQFLLLAVVLGLGIVIGVYFHHEAGQRVETQPGQEEVGAQGVNEAAPGPDYAGMIDALTRRQNKEERESYRLRKRVEQVETQVVLLQQAAEARSEEVEEEAAGGETGKADEADAGPDRESRLLNAGLEAEQARAVTRILEEKELEELYLRDQATREGWVGTPRYAQQQRALQDRVGTIRQELGDPVYDRYLFAMGRPNRLVVASVIENSAAQQAGIQAGDIIYGYGDERMFAVGDLRSATVGGVAGEQMLVDVVRDGQQLDFYLPRGPLGVRLNQTSVQP